MPARVLRPLLLTGALLLIAGSSDAGGAGALLDRWTAAMKSSGWVTAFLDASDRIYDLIIVKAGGVERVVYRAQAHDLQIGGPVVSRDGSQVAFVKVEEVAGQVRQRVYGVNADGSSMRELLELLPPTYHFRGANIGTSPVAWSHDGRKLVIVGTAKSPVPSDVAQQWEDPRSTTLLELDVATGRVGALRPIVRRKDRWLGPAITTQAWAPDNRRLVYLNDAGRITILDTTTGATSDLGVGFEPAWSPDGRSIAVTLIPEAGGRRLGDHVQISTTPPYERSTLLSNDRSRLSFRVSGYAGPALWLPDGRSLVVWQVVGERVFPCVLDRVTGELARLPPRYWGYSWGGKP